MSGNLNYEKLKIIKNNLEKSFQMHEGMLMGKSAVVSRYVHKESPNSPGEVSIFWDYDAGHHYLDSDEVYKAVHIDVYHEPADINAVDVAHRITRMIPAFLQIIDRNQDRRQEEKDLAAASLARKVHLYTSLGNGTALQPEHNSKCDTRYTDHVHILALIPTRYYSLIFCIVEAVERSIAFQGIKLRTIKKIIHQGKYPSALSDQKPVIYLPPFVSNLLKPVKSQNMFHSISSMAVLLGGLEKVSELFHSLTPLKRSKLQKLQDTNPFIGKLLSEMVSGNLVKPGIFGYSLTESGLELKNFLENNSKALSAQIRRSIRQYKTSPAKYKTLRYSTLKSKENHFPNRRKVLTPKSQGAWQGEIAIPETVVQAAKRTYFSRDASLKIRPEDIRVYARKSYAPVDTCMLIDCSGSMMGERIAAVGYVAEHLLLNSREKLALVTFQERDAKVAVPFTRNYVHLHRGIAGISPVGLTPLAKGISTALALIKQKRPRNPLLILITDGTPNYPLWTTDSIADSLTAARQISAQKIRFVCIGIDPDHRFLPLLAEAGNGNVYIVDENNRKTMIDIVTQERKAYQQHR
jgi:magnesium chelatase subunit D